MPFQGNPNAGQPDPALLNLLFQQKAQREERAYKMQQDALAAQRQAQLDAAEEARKDRKAQIDAANALFDLQSKVEDRAKTLGEAQTTARGQVDKVAASAPVSPQAAPIVNREPLPAGIFPLMPQDETNALTQLQAQDQYLGPVLAQQAALASSLQGIPEVSGLIPQIPALGQQAFQTKTRLDQEALQKKLDEEARKRTESDRIAYRNQEIGRQDRIHADELRDQNIIDDVVKTETAKVDASNALQLRRNGLQATIRQIKANGGDTTDLEEQVGIINGRIAAIREPRTVVNKSPIPFEQKVKLADGYTAADYTINRARDLWDAYQKGEVEFGVKGALEDVRLKAGSILQQIVQVDPNIDPETRGMIQQAIDSGSGTVKVSDQLSLGLDQILMTYGVARSGRGSVRFAVAEIKAIANQFNFTGVFTTPEQIQGGLRRAAQLAAREKALNKTLMAEDPDFQSAVTGIELLPEDQRALEFLGSISKTAPPPRAPVTKTGRVTDPNALSDEDLEAMFPQ